MEHSHEHAEEELKSKDLVAKINHVRLWKITVLPWEIVGLDRTKVTGCD